MSFPLLIWWWRMTAVLLERKKMNKLLFAVAIPVALLLTACGPDNPLIGEWDAEPQMGMKGSIEFTRGSMINKTVAFGTESETEVKVAEYKIEKDKVGVMVEQDGQKGTIFYRLVDADTIAQDVGFGAKVVFHRKK